jgi:protein-tyrosine-phosphatase
MHQGILPIKTQARTAASERLKSQSNKEDEAMRRDWTVAAVLILAGVFTAEATSAESAGSGKKMNPKLSSYVSERVGEFDQIPEERKQALKKIAHYVCSQANAGAPAKLIFICTHNSRRSQMSQIWAAEAANYYGVTGVECFSGGTEATAFNPRAIAALERAGIEIEKKTADKNAKCAVQIAEEAEPLICFSKKYSDDPNPITDFCAVMTCSNADKNCPLVQGATVRVAIPFEDPKIADDTPQEASKYDERCAQISREMLYMLSQVGA